MLAHVEVWYETIAGIIILHVSPIGGRSPWYRSVARLAYCKLPAKANDLDNFQPKLAPCLIRLLKRINLGCFDLFGPSVQFICNLLLQQLQLISLCKLGC